MNYDLVIIGGGRKKTHRNEMRRAVVDIESVLSDRLKIGVIWVDEHGYCWLRSGKEWKKCTIVGGKIILLQSNEFYIDDADDGNNAINVKRYWPLFFGEEYGWCGIAGMLDVAGAWCVGTTGTMSYAVNDMEVAKNWLKDISFEKKIIRINKRSWQNDYLFWEEKVANSFSFPIIVEADGIREKISVFENFSNVVFGLFEKETMEYLEIKEMHSEKSGLAISFLGKKNFLPSKVVQIMPNNSLYTEDYVLVRKIQDLVIGFVRNYDVGEFGIMYLRIDAGNLVVSNIDLYPDFSKDSLLAKIWDISGVGYRDLIGKIWNDGGNIDCDIDNN